MKVLAFDVETKDPYIKKYGSSFSLPKTRLLCASAAYYEKGEIDSFQLLEPDFLQELIDRADYIVGANIQYDLGFVENHWGITFDNSSAQIVDILVVERFFDTVSFRMNLDLLAERYLNENKISGALEEYAKNHGIKKVMENLDLLPLELVSLYCMKDCQLSLEVFIKQFKKARRLPAFQLEADLQKIIYLMNKTGVPIDTDYSSNLSEDMQKVIDEKVLALQEIFGTENFRTKDGKQILAEYCDKNGITYRTTSKTSAPQFDAKFFTRHASNEQLSMIKEYKALDKLKKDFVDKIRTMTRSDRVYPQINPMRGDEGGTITGRFSMAKPNLQQIPSREAFWAPKIRQQFRAPKDYYWVKIDYSQQEIRMMLHWAAAESGELAKPMLKQYREDPKTDCYMMAVNLCKERGVDISRSLCKKLILATQYCMGATKLSGELSKEEMLAILDSYGDEDIKQILWYIDYRTEKDKEPDEKDRVLRTYYVKDDLEEELAKKNLDLSTANTVQIKEAIRELELFIEICWRLLSMFKNILPFLKTFQREIIDRVENMARSKHESFITTINKRNVYLPVEFKERITTDSQGHKHKLPKEAYTVGAYKAINYLIQGSSADVTKQAMVNIYNRLALVPVLTVHDELGYILHRDVIEELVPKIVHEMENTFDLEVPMIADVTIGKSWGDQVDYEKRRELFLQEQDSASIEAAEVPV